MPSNPVMLARMSREARQLEQARFDEQSYRLNLELAVRERNREREIFYRRALFEALMMQGKLDEAALVTRHRPALKEEWRRAREARRAEALDDGERCACPDPVVEVPVNPSRPDQKTAPRAASRYVARRRYFSRTHGAFVTIYRCTRCGHKQAVAGEIDEMTARAEAARAAHPKPGEGPDAAVMPAAQ